VVVSNCKILQLEAINSAVRLDWGFNHILEIPAMWKERRWGAGNISCAARDVENKNKRHWNIMTTYEKICHDFL
jgi:hypothetical protein